MKKIIIQGKTLNEHSKQLGILISTLLDRYYKGWPPEKNLSQRGFRTRSTIYIINDELITAVEAEKRYGLHRNVIRQRYNRGLRDLDLVAPLHSRRRKID